MMTNPIERLQQAVSAIEEFVIEFETPDGLSTSRCREAMYKVDALSTLLNQLYEVLNRTDIMARSEAAYYILSAPLTLAREQCSEAHERSRAYLLACYEVESESFLLHRLIVREGYRNLAMTAKEVIKALLDPRTSAQRPRRGERPVYLQLVAPAVSQEGGA